jgi:predicted ATP-grasp superfamily ATP-dependent carboligase
MSSAVRARATVLLLGNYRATIALVRALSSAGHRVIVASSGDGSAEFSRFASEVWRHPPLEGQADAVLASLRAFLSERPDIGVVFPVTEEFVRLVSPARNCLPADRLLVLPSAEIVATTIDKVAAYRLAEAAGVPVAPWERIERHEDLAPCCARLGYPIVVRPLGPMRLDGRKALLIDTPADLARSVPVWPADQPALLVQRKVVGRRYNIYFAAHGGRIVRIASARVDRTDHPDGTGLAVAGRTELVDEMLQHYTAALVERLAYHGVGCAQYLIGPAGWSFLELNPRVAGNHAVPEAAGLELGAIAVALAAPASPDVPLISGRPGIVYAWTYGDLAGLKIALAERALSFRETLAAVWTVARTAVTVDFHITWRWDDPLPTLVLYGRRMPGLGRILGRRSPTPAPTKSLSVPLGET